LRAYLRRTLVNLAINDSRRTGSERAYLRKWTPAEPRAADQPDIETRHHLIAELRSLPPRQRAVVVLRYYEDMPEREIAATLGWPVGTVKSSLSRALSALRISMEEGPAHG
jgi:RNA polymerase sigma factor (sigma-70 family)